MKPIHQQEWKTRHTNIGPVIDDVSGHPDGEAVCMVYAPLSHPEAPLTLAQSDAIRDTRAKAIEALPDMVRALALAEELVNAIQQGHRVDEEFLERAHASINGARSKAGVLP